MIRLRHKLLIHFLRLFDQATIVLCVAVFGHGLADNYALSEVVALLLVLMGSMFLFNHFVRYDSNTFTEFGAQLRSLLLANTTTTVLVVLISLGLSYPTLSATGAFAVWSSSMAILATSRFFVRELLK